MSKLQSIPPGAAAAPVGGRCRRSYYPSAHPRSLTWCQRLAALAAVLVVAACATGQPGEAEARLAGLCKAHELVVQQLTPLKSQMSPTQVETVEASFIVREEWCTGQVGDAVAGLSEMAGSMGMLTQVQADLGA